MAKITDMSEFRDKRAVARIAAINGRLALAGVTTVSAAAARRSGKRLNDFVSSALRGAGTVSEDLRLPDPNKPDLYRSTPAFTPITQTPR